MKAVIIDDERRSHEVLEELLSRYHPEIEVLASGYNVKEGVKLIREHRPDLVFLDVEMPDGLGFDLLEQVGDLDFFVVFVTGYEKYAITAIKFGALDYLLKPVNREDLNGWKCPFHAHIRKVNPRSDDMVFKPYPKSEESFEARIVRRGVPYEEAGKGEGLLFMCYQARIRFQFEIIQKRWSNDKHFPVKNGSGIAPLSGQLKAGDQNMQYWAKRWNDPGAGNGSFDFRDVIRLRGGAYFYAPSLSYLETLLSDAEGGEISARSLASPPTYGPGRRFSGMHPTYSPGGGAYGYFNIRPGGYKSPNS